MSEHVSAVVRDDGRLILTWWTDERPGMRMAMVNEQRTHMLTEPTTAAANATLAGLGLRAGKWYPGSDGVVATAACGGDQ